MKHKKTVTEGVLAANRANSRSSTGPRTESGKSNSCRNALRHGILAKSVVLETDEQRREFGELVRSWSEEFSPEGLLEQFLVEDIATVHYKMKIALGCETRELSHRQDVQDGMDGVFHGDLKLPISTWNLPLDRGWECERVVVRAVAGKDNAHSSASRGPAVVQNKVISGFQNSQNQQSQVAGHLEIEAVFGSSLANMNRYQSSLRRDFYRAIEALRALQTERRERKK
jgi:hypothetical protein